MLERVSERIFQDGLFDLIKFTEELHKHLLAELLTGKLIRLDQLLALLLDYLLKLRHNFLSQRLITDELSFQVTDCGPLCILNQFFDLDHVCRKNSLIYFSLELFDGLGQAQLGA